MLGAIGSKSSLTQLGILCRVVLDAFRGNWLTKSQRQRIKTLPSRTAGEQNDKKPTNDWMSR